MEFLEELEHAQTIASVQQVCFLFKDVLFKGLDVFEPAVCLIGLVEGEQGATHLAVD